MCPVLRTCVFEPFWSDKTSKFSKMYPKFAMRDIKNLLYFGFLTTPKWSKKKSSNFVRKNVFFSFFWRTERLSICPEVGARSKTVVLFFLYTKKNNKKEMEYIPLTILDSLFNFGSEKSFFLKKKLGSKQL